MCKKLHVNDILIGIFQCQVWKIFWLDKNCILKIIFVFFSCDFDEIWFDH